MTGTLRPTSLAKNLRAPSARCLSYHLQGHGRTRCRERVKLAMRRSHPRVSRLCLRPTYATPAAVGGLSYTSKEFASRVSSFSKRQMSRMHGPGRPWDDASNVAFKAGDLRFSLSLARTSNVRFALRRKRSSTPPVSRVERGGASLDRHACRSKICINARKISWRWLNDPSTMAGAAGIAGCSDAYYLDPRCSVPASGGSD